MNIASDRTHFDFVAERWRQYLGHEADLDRDFVTLGGDSISAMRLLRDLEDEFETELDLEGLKTGLTVAKLVDQLERQKPLERENSKEDREPETQTTFAAPRDLPNPPQAAPMQRAYWIGEHGGLNGSCPAVYFLDLLVEKLDPLALQNAIDTIFNRHEILRLGINDLGQLVPDVGAKSPKLEFLALDQDVQDTSKRLVQFRDKLAQTRFEFRGDAPFAAGLANCRDQDHLYLTLPLWRFDAASTHILIQELLGLTQNGDAIGLPKAPDFTEFAHAWSSVREGKRYAEDKRFWMERVAVMPAPPALPRSAVGSNSGEFLQHINAFITAEQWEGLQRHAAKHSVTVANVAMTAFSCALARVSGSDHFTLTCLQSARYRFNASAADCLGNFGETLCIEFDRRDAPSFADLAKKTAQEMWAALAHMSYSGTEVAAAWRRVNNYGDGPTFPVTFTLAKDISGENTEIVAESGRLSVPQVHLDHQIFESENGVTLNIDYKEGVYLPGLPEEILETYHASLVALATGENAWDEPLPGRRGEQPLPPQIGSLTCDGERLEDGFLKQVALRPMATAVVSDGDRLSYLDLFEHAQHWSNILGAQGAAPGDRIAIHTYKGWHEIAAVLGTLLADMVYVPVHPSLPVSRKQAILESCGATLVLSCAQADENEALARGQNNLNILSLDNGRAIGGDPMRVAARNCELAYIIHTSGTTGVPKGVMLAHRASLNTIRDLLDAYQISHSDNCLGISQLSFDLSVFDIFGTLEAGGTLVLPSGEDEKNPFGWLELCRKESVTLWNSVPALMQLALDAGSEDTFEHLRLVFLSGDWIPLQLPASIRNANARAKIVAMGGATEAAIWSISHDAKQLDPNASSVPYGHAMRGQAVHVLQPDGRKCLTYEPGNIFIAGIGLAEGYWGDRAKTEARFVDHPENGFRMYDTGDLGRYLPNGLIEFLGRQDNQVKIQGYRIECGDIEAALLSHETVDKATVIGVEEAQGKALHAYLVAPSGSALVGGDLLRHLAHQLPPYMIPSCLFEVENLPLSRNGKIERSELVGLPARDLLEAKTCVFQQAQSETEKLLSDAWSDVLDIGEPGIDDDFFALGGTSLGGMILMARLSKSDWNLSLADLTAFPTIRKMADWLDGANSLGVQPEGVSGPMRRLGGKTGAVPLILLPPIGGNCACYAKLISLIDHEFEIYGITSPGLDGKSQPIASIPEMGRTFAPIISEMLIDRNPLLLGWSMGGLAAFEVAHALGKRPLGVVAIDARLAQFGGDAHEMDDEAAFLSDIRGSGGDAAQMAELLRAEETDSSSRGLARAALATFKTHRAALRDYMPTAMKAAAGTLIQAKQNASQQSGLELLFEQPLCVELDADHYSIMEGAALQTVAMHAIRAKASNGYDRLARILKIVRPGFDEPLSGEMNIGVDLGFSSIELVRIVSLVEDRLDIDLMEEGPDVFYVEALATLLGGRNA